MFSSSSKKYFCFIFVCPIAFVIGLEKCKIWETSYQNVIVKLFFFVGTKLVMSGHLKKLVSGIEKYHVKTFATNIQKYNCIKPTQSIKSGLIDEYDRFAPESFNLGIKIIKMISSYQPMVLCMQLLTAAIRKMCLVCW